MLYSQKFGLTRKLAVIDVKKDKEDDSGKLGADDFDTKKSGYLKKKSIYDPKQICFS